VVISLVHTLSGITNSVLSLVAERWAIKRR
jgi:hypothetical protein